MAKPKCRGIRFELLEDRCLLNGTMFVPRPMPDGPGPAFSQYAEMQPEHISGPSSILMPPDQTVAGRGPGQKGQFRDVSCGPIEVNQGAGNPRLPNPAQILAPLPPAIPQDAPPLPPSEPLDLTAGQILSVEPVYQALPDQPQVDPSAYLSFQMLIFPPAPPAAPPLAPAVTIRVLGSDDAASGQNQPAAIELTVHDQQPVVYVTANAASPSKPLIVAAVDGLASQQHSAASVATVQPVKTQSNNSTQIRDLSGIPIVPGIGKADRVALNQPIQLNNVAPGLINLGVPGDQTGPQSSQERQERSWSIVSVARAASSGIDAPGHVNESVPPISQAVADADQTSSGLLTSILPFDFASLDLSIKEFFSKIDKLGVQLSENHIDLLFSTSVMTAAAMLALEMARRKIQTPVPALTLQREGTIPYSDYP